MKTLDKPFLFNYGWDHFWYDPEYVENLAVREVVKGPFPKPKLVCSIPFVTRCQQEGTPVELREGIPDPWAEYLTRALRFSRKYLRNYELMHKEDVGAVSHLRKYRFYIGQGIPDPWAAYLYNPEIFSHLKDTEHRKRLKNKKEERCLCCEREYLFECPDKCVSTANHCSCQDCHGRNSPGSDSTEKCRCSEIFQNWLLDNRRRRRRRGSSGDGLSSPNGSHSETEDEGGNLKVRNKFAAYCECSGNRKGWECSGSENSGFGDGDHGSNEKTQKLGHIYFKHQPKVYFCPYIKHFCRRKSSTDGEPKISKEIQTEIPTIKSSKTVQTEKPEAKAQPKCTCRAKCFPYGVLCSRSWVKAGCPALHSIPSFCCSPASFTQKPAFVCPFSFSNHFAIQKHCHSESGQIKKRHKKKKHVKEKESDDGSNAELDQLEARGDNSAPKSKLKQDFHETTESQDHLKYNKSIYDFQTPSTTLDHMKFLASYKLKGYLPQEETSLGMPSNKYHSQNLSTGSKFGNISRGRQEDPMEKSKGFMRYRDSETAFHESKINIGHSNFSNIRRFSYCDQATMTPVKENEKHFGLRKNDPKEMIDSDEPRVCGARNHEVTLALGRRRKLLRNRKRRRRLVASILEYQDYSVKPTKRTSSAKKEVQIDHQNSKKFLNHSLTSHSDHLSFENTDYTGKILNSKYKQGVLKKDSGKFTSSQAQKIS